MPFWLLSKVCEPENGGLHRSLKVKVIVAQSCPTLCDLMNCSQPDSFVHGLLQARLLEWVAISFSRGTSWPRDWIWIDYCLSHQGSWETSQIKHHKVQGLQMVSYKLGHSSNFLSSCRDPWDLSPASQNLKMQKILQSVVWGRDCCREKANLDSMLETFLLLALLL